MSGSAVVLLVGASAVALAARLEASGYRTQVLEDPHAVSCDTLAEPVALVLVGSAQAGAAAAASPELLAQLRQRWPKAPLLLDIGRDSVAARSDCLSSGADDFWLSSIAASDLLGRIRLHLTLTQVPQPAAAPAAAAGSAPAPPQRSATLRHGSLQIDPERHQVHWADKPLKLTAREYALLELLLRHQGSVVSRERIQAEIWPEQAPGASNVIEVYVRYLRQKLEADGERRLIHTVRGRGYCLGDRPPRPGSRSEPETTR